MKIFAIAGLIALAVTTGSCRPNMRGIMQGGMMGMSGQPAGKSDSGDGMMMGDMAGKGMMSCCTAQCPMMKGKS